jgi:hypothetical protein
MKVFAAAIGLACLGAATLWPSLKVAIEMTLYTVIVFVPLLLFLWPERSRPAFQIGLFLAILFHGIVLYFIRSSFPLTARFFLIIPVALVEACGICVLMLKVLGDRKSS